MLEAGYAEAKVTVLDLKEQTFFSNVLNLSSSLKLKCLMSPLIRPLLSAS